jgi:alkylated DNA nucleotide flippase Atl1
MDPAGTIMTARTRFIASIVATAKSEKSKLPWHRGVARRASIERRRSTRSDPKALKSA